LPPSGQCRTLVIGQGFSSFEKSQALKYGPAEQNRILARAIVENIAMRLSAWLMSAGAADYFHCDIESKSAGDYCRAPNSGTDAAVSRLLNFFIRATEEKKGAPLFAAGFWIEKRHMIMTLLHANYPEAICTLECHCFYIPL
jgi:hypothetical protein